MQLLQMGIRLVRPEYSAALQGVRALALVATVLYRMDTEVLPGGSLGRAAFFAFGGFVSTNTAVRWQHCS